MKLLLGAFVLPLVIAGAATAAQSSAQTTTVTVKASDFKFALSRRTVPHGRVTFVVKNVGHTAHDFAIAGHKTSQLSPGRTARLTVRLKRGRYTYKCTVDSHAALGMKGVLRVT